MEQGLPPEVRRKVLRRLTYGLHVATALLDGEPLGATITWVSQASFEPPLVMAAIKAGSRLNAAVVQGGQFALNTVGEGQKAIAQAFFKPTTVEGPLLNGQAFEPGPLTGAPLLVETPSWLELRVAESYDRGDHTVFIAEVIGGGVRDEGLLPLALRETGWSYGG
jgi:flavin reductase (DIM6/NTAB) family NADH-FMN oxidoreductase RutF